MRIITCHIGSISPRRQARERRSLQTPETIFRHNSSCLAQTKQMITKAFICRLCGVPPGKALRWLTWTMLPSSSSYIFHQRVHVCKRTMGEGALWTRCLWYTKRVPTLHGGGSFGSPYERSDPIDICISPSRSPLGHSKPPHFSETLALFCKSFQARP